MNLPTFVVYRPDFMTPGFFGSHFRPVRLALGTFAEIEIK